MGFLDSGGLDFLGGLANGAMGLIGSSITNYRRQRRSQQKYDKWHFENIEKQQMALSQEYNERNMELQNQYQIDAENRANAYNDPSAQLARARQAGMNPQAVMSDAGVQGSISSAPDSSAPQSSSGSGHAGTKDYSALGRLDILGMIQSVKEVDSQLKLNKSVEAKNYAEASRLTGQESRDSQLFETNKKILELTADNKDLQNQSLRIQNYIADASAENDIAIKEANWLNALATLDNILADTNLKQEQRDYYVQQKTLIQSSVDVNKATIGNLKADTFYKTMLGNTEKENKELVKANTEVAKARKAEIDKHIEKIGKDMELTDQQIREVKNKIALMWSEFGVNTAIAVSQEARGWICWWKNTQAQPVKSSLYTPSSTSFDGTSFKK